MPRIEGDFAELLLAVATGGAFDAPALSPKSSMTVVIAAHGYPGTPRKGAAIGGIEAAEREPGVTVYHSGTARQPSGALVAGGGRVLAVTAIAESLANARARAYRAVDAIEYSEGFHRRDIGWRQLERDHAA